MERQERQLQEQKTQIEQMARQQAQDKQNIAAEASAAATLAVAAVAPDVRSAIAANKDEWSARIGAMKAEATASRDLAIKEAHDLEVRLSAQNDTLNNNLMGLISHNAKMAKEQRDVDSLAAGKRMDDLSAKMELMCASMQGMNANIERLLAAAPPTPSERPKGVPRVSKTARVEGVKSVAAAVAVVENAKAQAEAGTHAPAGM